MKIKPSITQSICSGIKSKIAPGLQGFGVVLFISQASFAVAETIDKVYVVTDVDGATILDASTLPPDGKLSGSITVNNGTADAYTAFDTLVVVDLTSASSALTLEDFKITVTNYGVDNIGEFMDTYAIKNGTVSLKNSQIFITTTGGENDSYVYGIQDSKVIDFDASSLVDLDVDLSNVTEIYGMRATVQNFAGDVEVESESRGQGVILRDTGEYGTQFASTASVSVTTDQSGTALNYTLLSSTPTESLALFDGKFTATSTASGFATAAWITASASDYDRSVAKSISGTYTAAASLNAQALVLNGQIYAKTIDAVLEITTTSKKYTSDAVAYVGKVGIVFDGDRMTGFDEFSGTITATGGSNAVGMELQHVGNVVNSSGTISASISASTEDTYFLTRDEYGDIVQNTEGFDRSTSHFKSTAAIRIIDQPAPAGPQSATSALVTELNFADGAKAEALVGAEGSPKSYGDAIQFTTDQLVLNAAPNATVTLIGDITTDADAYSADRSDGGGVEDVSAGDRDGMVVSSSEASATTSTSRRVLTYNEGTYNVSSDYWFVSQVELGNSETSATGHVRLLDSTRFVATDTLNFHVNSATDYSNITVSAAEILTVSELGDVNVTLGADLMHTENFEINLIAGNMLDTAGNELFITLTDLVIGDGTAEGSLGDDLASIYVIYNGEKTFYTEGMSILMDGNSKNLTIGRGMIPEPSTATLSLLALAGLIARRRRQGV